MSVIDDLVRGMRENWNAAVHFHLDHKDDVLKGTGLVEDELGRRLLEHRKFLSPEIVARYGEEGTSRVKADAPVAVRAYMLEWRDTYTNLTDMLANVRRRRFMNYAKKATPGWRWPWAWPEWPKIPDFPDLERALQIAITVAVVLVVVWGVSVVVRVVK